MNCTLKFDHMGSNRIKSDYRPVEVLERPFVGGWIRLGFGGIKRTRRHSTPKIPPLSTHPRLLDADAASSVLGVHRKTLIRWARNGLITGYRPNPSGKWGFDVSSVGVQIDHGAVAPAGPIDAIYARVSTRKQLNDLQSQVGGLKAKYPDHVVFTDCASGLDFKRKSLLSLLQLAFERRLRVVRVAHRDRLCRFAFDLLEHVFRVHGASVSVEASDLPSSAESELAEDVLAVITVFGARSSGGRRINDGQEATTGRGNNHRQSASRDAHSTASAGISTTGGDQEDRNSARCL